MTTCGVGRNNRGKTRGADRAVGQSDTWGRPGLAPFSSKILVSRSDSGLGRTNGGGLTRAVGVCGCLRDLREPEVRGRASDGATTATDMVYYSSVRFLLKFIST